MVVRTENIETPQTQCHIFHDTEILVCLFVFLDFCCCCCCCLFGWLLLFFVTNSWPRVFVFFILPRSIHHLPP